MADGSCTCGEGANPTVVKFRVMKSQDGLYAGPRGIFGVDLQAAIIGATCDIRVHEAESFGSTRRSGRGRERS